MDAIETPLSTMDRAMDVAVATEVAGFRSDRLAHLHLPATLTEAAAEDSIARVPWYSVSLTEAFRAADEAGVFREGQATLCRTASGSWRIQLPTLNADAGGAHLTIAVCPAALLWVRGRRTA